MTKSHPRDSSTEPPEPAFDHNTQEHIPEFDIAPQKKSKIKRLLKRLPKKRVAAIGGALSLVAAGVIVTTPLGYPVLGTFMKQDIQLAAIDDKFNLEISDISIAVDNTVYDFSDKGPFVISDVSAGTHTIRVSKDYYQIYESTITIKPFDKRSDAKKIDVRLTPTGKPALVKILNRLTGEPIEGADIDLKDSQAKTNDAGEATVVLPSSANEAEVTVKKDGYLDFSTTVLAVETNKKENTVNLTPAGKAYFFSKQTGKIDLYQSNLDGSDRKVALAGTGNESDQQSILISPDARWIAFTSSRDGTRGANGTLLEKLYVFDTSNDELTTVEEGPILFGDLTWTTNNTLVYQTVHSEYTSQTKDREKLKLYDPVNAKQTTIYSNNVTGPDSSAYDPSNMDAFMGVAESLWNHLILPEHIVYTIRSSYYNWGGLPSQPLKVVIADLDGKTIDTIVKQGYDVTVAKRGNTKISLEQSDFSTGSSRLLYSTYDITTKAETAATPEVPTPEVDVLISPDGSTTARSEARDGKKSVIIQRGTEEKSIYSSATNEIYHWLNDDYLLFYNQENETGLYVIHKDGGIPLKVSDVHLGQRSFPRY